jgi:hypothetical protein
MMMFYGVFLHCDGPSRLLLTERGQTAISPPATPYPIQNHSLDGKIVLRPPKDDDDRRPQDDRRNDRDEQTKRAVRDANDRRHRRR